MFRLLFSPLLSSPKMLLLSFSCLPPGRGSLPAGQIEAPADSPTGQVRSTLQPGKLVSPRWYVTRALRLLNRASPSPRWRVARAGSLPGWHFRRGKIDRVSSLACQVSLHLSPSLSQSTKSETSNLPGTRSTAKTRRERFALEQIPLSRLLAASRTSPSKDRV